MKQKFLCVVEFICGSRKCTNFTMQRQTTDFDQPIFYISQFKDAYKIRAYVNPKTDTGTGQHKYTLKAFCLRYM